MSKKRKNRAPKTGPVWHRTADEATLDRMPKYNGHICATGVQGDTKYNRSKQKRNWKRQLRQEEVRNRGPLPLYVREKRHPGHRESAKTDLRAPKPHSIDARMMFRTEGQPYFRRQTCFFITLRPHCQ